MARPRNAHLSATWKLSIPATTAARVDVLFEDPLTGRPKYGARGRLIDALLCRYLAELNGETLPPIPSLSDLRQTEGD